MLNGCGPYGRLKLCCPLLVAACVPHSCGLYRSLLTLMVTGHSAVPRLSAIEATTSDNTSAVRSGRTKYLKIFAKILSIKLQPAAGLGVFGCRKVRTYYWNAPCDCYTSHLCSCCHCWRHHGKLNWQNRSSPFMITANCRVLANWKLCKSE